MQKTSSIGSSQNKKSFKTEQSRDRVAPSFFVWFPLLVITATAPQGAVHGASPSPVISPSGVGPAEGTKSEPAAAPSLASSSAPLGETQKKQLELEFKQALQTELAALNHQMSSEWKALKASQRAREREWKSREKTARRDFFKTTTVGAEKTKWMEDRKARYHAFKKDLVEELKRVKTEQLARRAHLLEDQKLRLSRLQESLSQGKSPDAELWHPSRWVPSTPQPEAEAELVTPATRSSP